MPLIAKNTGGADFELCPTGNTQAVCAFVEDVGMQVNEITPDEQKRLFEKVKPVYDRNTATIGAETINSVMDALKKVRGG